MQQFDCRNWYIEVSPIVVANFLKISQSKGQGLKMTKYQSFQNTYLNLQLSFVKCLVALKKAKLTTLFYVPWYTLHNDGLLQLTTPSKVVLPPWLFRQEICSHWIFNSAPKGIFWRQEIWVLKGRKKERVRS